MSDQGRPPQSYGGSSALPPRRRPETRTDVAAALAARQELGPEYEDHIAAGLAERVEELVAYRTAEMRQQGTTRSNGEDLERVGQRQRFVLGIVSLGAGIPITGIAAGTDLGLPGLVVAWAGIVGVNLVHRISRRRD